jgi:hypothetical protein
MWFITVSSSKHDSKILTLSAAAICTLTMYSFLERAYHSECCWNIDAGVVGIYRVFLLFILFNPY